MPFLEYGQRLYPLVRGDQMLGSDPECDVRLPGLAAGARVRIVVGPDGARLEEPVDPGLLINGRPAGGARRLRHEDRIGLGGQELLYVDEAGSSSTGARERAAAPPRGSGLPARGGAAIESADPDGSVPVLVRVDDATVRAIDPAGLRIGRERTCHIVIPDPSVSRLHAEITVEGTAVVLRDLGRNGTHVNGERIEDPRVLRPGDRIRVGRYEFDFARRPVALAEPGGDTTPMRAVVPDAPTVRQTGSGGTSGSGGWLRWAVILVVAALAAAVLLGLLGP